MKSKSILVTGGAGYIGSHVVRRLLQDGHVVVVFDNFSRGYKDALEAVAGEGNLTVIVGDLRNKEDIEKASLGRNIDAVFHLAALCSIDESMKQPELYRENNVLGTDNLVRAMQHHGVKKIVFSSTCAVYGEGRYFPIDEEHPTRPTNPYGESKYASEKIVRDAQDVASVTFRYFNVIGAADDGVLGDSKKPSLLLVQNAIRGALGIEPFAFTYERVDTKDGSPIRDFVDVLDIAEAHLQALSYLDQGGKSDVFNIGTGQGHSVLSVVKAVEQELGCVISAKAGEMRKGETKEVYASNEKAKQILGWTAKRTIKESIHALKRWYEKHPNGFLS